MLGTLLVAGPVFSPMFYANNSSCVSVSYDTTALRHSLIGKPSITISPRTLDHSNRINRVYKLIGADAIQLAQPNSNRSVPLCHRAQVVSRGQSISATTKFEHTCWIHMSLIHQSLAVGCNGLCGFFTARVCRHPPRITTTPTRTYAHTLRPFTPTALHRLAYAASFAFSAPHRPRSFPGIPSRGITPFSRSVRLSQFLPLTVLGCDIVVWIQRLFLCSSDVARFYEMIAVHSP